jgi:hypothetical protein
MHFYTYTRRMLLMAIGLCTSIAFIVGCTAVESKSASKPNFVKMKLESLSFSDRYDILLENRLSGVAGLRYTMVYGKSQL